MKKIEHFKYIMEVYFFLNWESCYRDYWTDI